MIATTSDGILSEVVCFFVWHFSETLLQSEAHDPWKELPVLAHFHDHCVRELRRAAACPTYTVAFNAKSGIIHSRCLDIQPYIRSSVLPDIEKRSDRKPIRFQPSPGSFDEYDP
jgi:hypothetical protein